MIYEHMKKALHTWNHDLFVWGWVGAGMRAITEGSFENNWYTFSLSHLQLEVSHGQLLR